MSDYIFKKANFFMDFIGHVGEIEEMTLPKLVNMTEDFKGAHDFGSAQDMGMEPLDLAVTLSGYDPTILGRFGLSAPLVFFNIRGSLLMDDGSAKGFVSVMRGRIKEMDMGAMKNGERSSLQLTSSLIFYSLEIDEQPIHLIDKNNQLRIIGGVDQLAQERKNLGI